MQGEAAHGWAPTRCNGGERVAVRAAPGWVARLLRDHEGELAGGPPAVRIVIERSGAPFTTDGWDVLGRHAWSRGGQVVMQDIGGSGFDLLAQLKDTALTCSYRWRPAMATRLVHHARRGWFRVLAQAVLVHYPVLWWAGRNGRAPLHVSSCTAGPATPLLVGPSGVGKTTIITRELAAGGRATSDNLCVSDGAAVWGIVEPLRTEHGHGHRTTHGRRESRLPNRVPSLRPDRIVILRRGGATRPALRTCDPSTAERAIVTATYTAGELRRYWGFAATLSAGLGVGPPHPPVTETARKLAQRLPCFELELADEIHRLAEVLADHGLVALSSQASER